MNPEAKSEGRYSDNLVKQEFEGTEPDKVWAEDITCIKSALGMEPAVSTFMECLTKSSL